MANNLTNENAVLSKDDLNGMGKRILAVRITNTYKPEFDDLPPRERIFKVYECTRGCWVVNRRKAAKVDLVIGVYNGVVKGVFVPEAWLDAHSTMNTVLAEENIDAERSEFVGREAKDQFAKDLLGRQVDFTTDEPNPVAYFGF